MTKSVSFAKTTLIMLSGVYLLALSIAAIVAIFGAISWQVVGEYALKTGLAAIVIVVLASVLGALTSLGRK